MAGCLGGVGDIGDLLVAERIQAVGGNRRVYGEGVSGRECNFD